MKRRLISVRRSAMLLALMGFNSMASTDKPTSYTLKWSEVEGASHYLLEEKQSDGSWKGVHEQQTVEQQTTISKTSHGKYTYRVSGCITDSSQKVHCGEEVAEYSESLTVDTANVVPGEDIFDFFSATNDSNTVAFPEAGSGSVTAVTPGQFRIDESGNATYQVPFELPVGPGGVQPELGLSYSSSNTHIGAAGIGWSLSGLSVITRCPKSHFYDKLGSAFVEDVQLDQNDAFCVDGQRLIEIESGKFRTEQDSFTEYQISLSGSEVLGFTATTKSNDTYYYGEPSALKSTVTSNSVKTIQSELTANVAVANTWALSAVSDLYGNQIDYQYMSSNQQVTLQKVTYGPVEVSLKHSTLGSGVKYGYRLGQRYQQSHYLTSVSVKVDNQHYRYYDLDYETVDSNKYLTSVTLQRDASRGKSRPVTFTWDNAASGFNNVADYTLDLSDTDNAYAKVTRILDLNGDGYSDLIAPTSNDKWKVKFGNKDGNTYISVAIGNDPKSHYSFKNAQVTDFNGDGRQDLIIPAHDGNEIAWQVIYYEPKKTTTQSCENEAKSQWGYEQVAEPEFCHPVVSTTLLKSKELFRTPNNRFGNTQLSAVDNVRFADVNGDGLMDLTYLVHNRKENALSMIVSSTVVARLNLAASQGSAHFGDEIELLNTKSYQEDNNKYSRLVTLEWGEHTGDGLSDIIAVMAEHDYGTINMGHYGSSYAPKNIKQKHITFINHGMSFDQYSEFASESFDGMKYSSTQTDILEPEIKLSDLNGDGLTDVIYKDNGLWYGVVSNGVGYLNTRRISPLNNKKKEDFLFMDFDSNGRVNLVVYDDKNKYWQVYETRSQGSIYGFYESEKYTGNSSGGDSYRSILTLQKADEDAIQYGDFDGDGATDWALYSSSAKAWKMYHQDYQKFGQLYKRNAIHAFKDGMGNTTRVEYRPLTDTSVYEGVVEARFPILSVTNPMYVVSKATSPSGSTSGGVASVDYVYANMAFHGQGRGFLGFGRLTTIDSRHSDYYMVSSTEYSQGLDEEEEKKTYLKSPELVGMPLSTKQTMVSKSDSTEILLSESSNSYETITTVAGSDPNVVRSPYFTFVKTSVESSYLLDTPEEGQVYTSGALKSKTTTTQSFDSHGNLTKSEVKVTDRVNNTYTTTTENNYSNAPADCPDASALNSFSGDYARFGRLTCTKVTKEAVARTTETRLSAFGYNSKGVLAAEVVNANDENLKVTTTYGFDSHGNRKSTKVSAKQLQHNNAFGNKPTFGEVFSRESRVKYDEQGRFIEYEVNAAGHAICYERDSTSGLVTSKRTHLVEDSGSSSDLCAQSGGMETKYSYNIMGQLVGEKSPSNIVTAITREINSVGLKETVNRSGKQPKVTQYNKMGKPISEITYGFDANKTSVVYISYDNFGRAYRQSLPVQGSAHGLLLSGLPQNKLLLTEYDVLGRVVKTTSPSFNGETVTVTTKYDDFVVFETHSSGDKTIVKRKSYNALGELITVTDNSGQASAGSIVYGYDAHGQLKTTRDGKRNVVVMSYDVLGNKISMQDPDKGNWQYAYNGFGELKWQKDANGAVTWFDYDALGRTIARIDNAQSGFSAQSRCFNYDTLGVGTLESEKVVTGRSCDVDANKEFEKTYLYDALYRPEAVATTIYNSSKENYTVKQSTSYDALGRVYLKRLSETFAVGYKYNARGFKYQEVGLRYNPQTHKVDETTLKTISTVNHRNQVTSETYAGQTLSYGYDDYTGLNNGLTASGIQTGRDGAQGFSAAYHYNGFGQLSTRTFTSLYSKNSEETFTYDGLNRLSTATTKFGTVSQSYHYCYDALGNMLKKRSDTACSTGTNRFEYGSSARTNGNAGPHALRLDNKTGKTYHYDNNGNMTSDGERTLRYSGFDKVTQIQKNNALRVDFSYGAGLSRYYRKDTYLSGADEAKGRVNRETYYLGAYQRIETDLGEVTKQYHVGNMQITENMTTGKVTHKLLVRDHLGSVLAVSEINANHTAGKLVQTFRYDPFGQQYAMSEGLGSLFEGYMRQGFTGHEMLNEVNIIHMNGRIYDPTLGRFLQADPHIQAPQNSQSYNRYSYVLNNPLSYTDPSGYFFNPLKKLGRNIIRAATKIFGKEVVNIVGTIVATVYGGPAGAAIWTYEYNRAMGVPSSGALKAAAISYVTASAFQQIGEHFTALSGGEGATINFGGNVLTGSQVAQQIFAHAMVGGVSSTLQGGKFGHGFFSAGVTKGAGGAFLAGSADIGGALDLAKNTVISAMIGGTASVISGGKFSNGARTAAMQYLLNQAGKVDYAKIRKDMWRTFKGFWSDTIESDPALRVGSRMAAKPLDSAAALTAIGGGIVSCSTGVGCPGGALFASIGLDQLSEIVMGMDRSMLETGLDAVYSDPEVRMALPFLPEAAKATDATLMLLNVSGAGRTVGQDIYNSAASASSIPDYLVGTRDAYNLLGN
ncbi:toxin TcdB middle/N-terminal domain-containing protein [Pseudoalteromonas rubra]|uniref:toxin TcdB middle/N-terminal domain-containing protein n=1 Tax=Pseudoalteromonas rubra TaxID=43658 RepID=UPI000F794D1A|nr:toxin TcdB middle/N-terminal domain-containing protein [Pseudoalteromonas rubra]